MKKLLFYFMLLPFFSFAQEVAEPFSDADLIIVETKGSPEGALKQLAHLMQEKGFFIQDYNKELLNIIAAKQGSHSYNLEVRVNAYLREKENGMLNIYFFAEYNSQNGESQFQGKASYNHNLLRRFERTTFEEINSLAKAYPGGSIKYGKL